MDDTQSLVILSAVVLYFIKWVWIWNGNPILL